MNRKIAVVLIGVLLAIAAGAILWSMREAPVATGPAVPTFDYAAQDSWAVKPDPSSRLLVCLARHPSLASAAHRLPLTLPLPHLHCLLDELGALHLPARPTLLRTSRRARNCNHPDLLTFVRSLCARPSARPALHALPAEVMTSLFPFSLSLFPCPPLIPQSSLLFFSLFFPASFDRVTSTK